MSLDEGLIAEAAGEIIAAATEISRWPGGITVVSSEHPSLDACFAELREVTLRAEAGLPEAWTMPPPDPASHRARYRAGSGWTMLCNIRIVRTPTFADGSEGHAS